MTAALLSWSPEVEGRVRGRPFVVMLDVDGTLAPIVDRPEAASVPDDTRRAVAALAVREGVHVALVSGRAASDARRLVGVAATWVIGNHGCEVVSPEGESSVDPRVAPYRPAMARVAGRLRAQIASVPGVVLEDKTWTLSVHYRLADPAVVPRLRAAIENVIEAPGLLLAEGKMVFEVRPPVTVHKGTAVLALAERLGGLAEGASLLFAGDDRTDEDAFRSLRAREPDAVTIRVADTEVETAAEFVLPDPDAVRELLQRLATLRR